MIKQIEMTVVGPNLKQYEVLDMNVVGQTEGPSHGSISGYSRQALNLLETTGVLDQVRDADARASPETLRVIYDLAPADVPVPLLHVAPTRGCIALGPMLVRGQAQPQAIASNGDSIDLMYPTLHISVRYRPSEALFEEHYGGGLCD